MTNGSSNSPASSNYIYSSVDRTDSTKGYTHENAVPACKNCQFAKRDLTLEEFKSWVKRAYERMWPA